MEVNLSKAVKGFEPITDGAVEGIITAASETLNEAGEVVALRIQVRTALDRTDSIFLNLVPNEYQDETKIIVGIARALESVGYPKREIVTMKEITPATFENRPGLFEYWTNPTTGKQKLGFTKPYTFKKLHEENKIAKVDNEPIAF